MKILQKLLNVLPAVAVGLASYSWLAPGESVAAEFAPVSTKNVQLRSSIAGHSDTMWSALDHAYQHRTVDQLPLSLSYEFDDQSYENADLVELQLHDAIAACDAGRLNLLPLHQMYSRNDGYRRSVVANGVQPCSVGHSLWATVLTYNEARMDSENLPALIQDFFNTDAYPGKRAIKKSPRALVEWALLNNGYPNNQIYSAMALEQAWQSVEFALDAMASDIVWVDSDQEALELVDSGLATFAAVSTNNLVREIASRADTVSNRYGVIWNGAIAHMSMLAIPKQSAALDAMRLLRFVTDPTRNVQMSTAYGYAPVQVEQVALIEDRFRHALPVGAQLDNLIWGNSKWWREEGAEIEIMFYDYLNRAIGETESASLSAEYIGS